ncbi:MAG: hypothetical protein R2911_41030 [Caldilineaceae bacterium]
MLIPAMHLAAMGWALFSAPSLSAPGVAGVTAILPVNLGEEIALFSPLPPCEAL